MKIETLLELEGKADKAMQSKSINARDVRDMTRADEARFNHYPPLLTIARAAAKVVAWYDFERTTVSEIEDLREALAELESVK